MSLDVGLVESVVDLQSIVPSIALATFLLSGFTVRSEVKEQGKEMKNAMSVLQKDLKEELSVQQKDLKEEVKMQLQVLKEDMGTQLKDLKEEIRTVRGEVSMHFFVGVDLQFHASPFDLMLNVHAHFVEGDPNESLTSGRIQISTDFLTKTNGKVGGLSFKVGALDGKLDSLERRGMDLN